MQLLERQVWARVIDGQAAEPMDGCFVHEADGELRVLGIFGLRRDRDGFSAVETAGPRPSELRRPDGTPLFSPVLAGGRLLVANSAAQLVEVNPADGEITGRVGLPGPVVQQPAVAGGVLYVLTEAAAVAAIQAAA